MTRVHLEESKLPRPTLKEGFNTIYLNIAITIPLSDEIINNDELKGC